MPSRSPMARSTTTVVLSLPEHREEMGNRSLELRRLDGPWRAGRGVPGLPRRRTRSHSVRVALGKPHGRGVPEQPAAAYRDRASDVLRESATARRGIPSSVTGTPTQAPLRASTPRCGPCSPAPSPEMLPETSYREQFPILSSRHAPMPCRTASSTRFASPAPTTSSIGPPGRTCSTSTSPPGPKTQSATGATATPGEACHSSTSHAGYWAWPPSAPASPAPASIPRPAPWSTQKAPSPHPTAPST